MFVATSTLRRLWMSQTLLLIGTSLAPDHTGPMPCRRLFPYEHLPFLLLIGPLSQTAFNEGRKQ